MIDPNNPRQTADLATQYVELRKSGIAPHPRSPAGAALLSAYNRWKDAQTAKEHGTAPGPTLAIKATREDVDKARRKAAKKAAKRLRQARIAAATAGPGLEQRAIRKAEKTMRYCAENKVPGNPAGAGFAAYQRAGGRLTRAAFGRKMQGLS